VEVVGIGLGVVDGGSGSGYQMQRDRGREVAAGKMVVVASSFNSMADGERGVSLKRKDLRSKRRCGPVS
jgi:hypothetical protein